MQINFKNNYSLFDIQKVIPIKSGLDIETNNLTQKMHHLPLLGYRWKNTLSKTEMLFLIVKKGEMIPNICNATNKKKVFVPLWHKNFIGLTQRGKRNEI